MMGNTLSELITRFLEHLEVERNVSQLTIRNYHHYLNRFMNFLSKRYPDLMQADHVDE
ncbi:site-specific integrase, partial [Candidatus Roizmanbacteria bacterium]|nr:site-specific integrase [Candidatus Roizmanbacteria bacterium]